MSVTIDNNITNNERANDMDNERVQEKAKGVAADLWVMHQALQGDADAAAVVVQDATDTSLGEYLALGEDERADMLRDAILGYADDVYVLRTLGGELRAVVLSVSSSPLVEIELPACGVADGEVRVYSGGSVAVRSAHAQAVATLWAEHVEGMGS